MQKTNLKELNNKLPNLRTLYDILTDNKGYFLPKFHSKAWTLDYLLKVVGDQKIFKINRNLITKPPMVKQRKTVEELVEIINNLLKTKSLELGFSYDNQPDINWLIDVLFYLEPKNPIFTIEEDICERPFPKE